MEKNKWSSGYAKKTKPVPMGVIAYYKISIGQHQ